MADGDFDEDEVWSVIGHREKREIGCRSKKSSDATTPKRAAYSASRMIPRSGGTGNSPEARIFQQSAPVNIPDWTKIYRKGGIASWDCACDDEYNGGGGGGGHGFEGGGQYRGSVDDGADDDEEDDDRVPPHELIAKKLARSHITTSSVYEGAGRTLKGRDLSKEPFRAKHYEMMQRFVLKQFKLSVVGFRPRSTQVWTQADPFTAVNGRMAVQRSPEEATVKAERAREKSEEEKAGTSSVTKGSKPFNQIRPSSSSLCVDGGLQYL